MQPDDAHQPELSPATVAAFLSQRFEEKVQGVERIGHGEWSKAFTFRRRDGHEYVARFSALDEDFLKDRRAMGYASAALPVPELVELGEAFGGYYAISVKAYGEFVERLDDASMRRLLPALFSMWDAARNVNLSSTSGFGLWRGDGNAPHPSWRDAVLSVAVDAPTNRTHGWRERLQKSPTAVAVFEDAYSEVKTLVAACPEERRLVHSDLLYFNLLVSGDRISSVLDWGSSMYGDFLWDLAWFTLWQPWYPAWSAVDFRAAALAHYADIGLGVPRFEERMRCYELCIGLDGMAYQAFAGHWTNLEWTTNRVLGLLRTPLPR
jgi:hygromycin-B 4-O-kinase